MLLFAVIAVLSVNGCLGVRFSKKLKELAVYDNPVPAATCVDVLSSPGFGFLSLDHPDRLSFEMSSSLCKKEEEEGGVGSVARISQELLAHRELLTSRAQKASKPIWFLHTSKNAGTFFCGCANHQGLNPGLPHDIGVNCHFLKEDWPMWGWDSVPPWAHFNPTDPHTSDCSTMTARFERRGIDVEGNENVLPTGKDTYFCPTMRTVAFLRDPINRFFSMLQTLGWSEQRIRQLTPEKMNHTWPVLTNNFFTRSLLGYEMVTLPLEPLHDRHLESAKTQVSAFEYIFFVDARLTDNLKLRLGWACGDGNVAARHSAAKGGTQGVSNRMADVLGSSFEELITMMSLDRQLFDYGRLLNFVRGEPSS